MIDYRLGFRFIENEYHVFLKISEKDAVDRLKKTKKRKNKQNRGGNTNDSRGKKRTRRG